MNDLLSWRDYFPQRSDTPQRFQHVRSWNQLWTGARNQRLGRSRASSFFGRIVEKKTRRKNDTSRQRWNRGEESISFYPPPLPLGEEDDFAKSKPRGYRCETNHFCVLSPFFHQSPESHPIDNPTTIAFEPIRSVGRAPPPLLSSPLLLDWLSPARYRCN